MAAKSKTYDWGGISLIVEEIRLATKAGVPGTTTTLSSTELEWLDGVTAGTGAVSKAMVLDSSGDIAMPAGGLVTGVGRQVVADATSVGLTAAQSGSVIHMDLGAAVAITLPAAAVGLNYSFWVGVTTHASTTITCAEGDFYVGALTLHDSDTAASEVIYIGDGSADDIITLNATTTGGIQGSWIDMVALSGTQWLVRGHLINSGDDADPFSA